MEVCPGFKLIAIENAAALGHNLLELSKRPEVVVGEWLIQDGPEVPSRLEFGRVPGQVDEPDALRHDQVRCGVPAGAVKPDPRVKPEDDDAIPSRPGLAGKQGQSPAKNGLETPFDTDQNTSPEIGWTKAVT